MNTPVTMQSHAENYLDERRQLGYGLRTTGYAIRSFARYVDGLGYEGPLTVEIMAAWARRAKTNGDSPTIWARRLKKLRPFARYLQQFDPRTEVPDHTVFGRVGQRLAPHIYSEQEIVDLLATARRLSPALRGATYETLFGLLAATGLRISEASASDGRGCRPEVGYADRPADQVRQIPPCTAASEHCRGVAAVSRTVQTAISRSRTRRRSSSAHGASVWGSP